MVVEFVNLFGHLSPFFVSKCINLDTSTAFSIDTILVKKPQQHFIGCHGYHVASNKNETDLEKVTI